MRKLAMLIALVLSLFCLERVYSQQFITPSIGASTCAYGTVSLPPLAPGSFNLIQCADACQTAPHVFVPISVTTATTTKIMTGAAGTKIYLCYLLLNSAIANNVAVVEGTGAACGGSTTGIVGGATAANGLSIPAAGNVAMLANFSAVGVTAVSADNVCLITSSVGPLAGVAVFAQQ